MTRSLRLRTPAKVNLGLALVGTRADGYHLLESVFAPIALFDEVELAVDEPGGPAAAAIELVCGPPLDATLPDAVSAIPTGPENLVWRAARLFCDRTGWAPSIRIGLRKGIPAGAGLGGGSSDAAAVLSGLARLSGRTIEPAELAAWALALGADVPFFLEPALALVSGIGERIERVEGVPELALVVVNPGKTLATADVYRMADTLSAALTKNRAGSTMRALSGLTRTIDDIAPALRALLINDLEPAARRLCPPVARIADRLAEVGAIAVSMTGSGATVLGVFRSGREASEAEARLLADDRAGSDDQERWWIRATRTLSTGREA